MDHPATPVLRSLSFCTGGYGLDLGLKLVVPWARTVCCVEHEASAITRLAARMSQGLIPLCPLWSDVRTFDSRPWRGVVDCILGGYPCQPFSNAGLKRGESDPRHLWPSIADHVEVIFPSIVWFENVSAHLTQGYRKVRCDLEDIGYRVAQGLFRADGVGATHKRERLFILGIREDMLGGLGLAQSGGFSGLVGGSMVAGQQTHGRREADHHHPDRPSPSLEDSQNRNRWGGTSRIEEEEGSGRDLSSNRGTEPAHHHHHQGREGRGVRGCERTDERAAGTSDGSVEGLQLAHSSVRDGQTIGSVQERQSNAQGSGSVVANQQGRGCGIIGGAGGSGHGGHAQQQQELPLFPPGPGQFEDWFRVLSLAALNLPRLFRLLLVIWALGLRRTLRLNPLFVEWLMGWPEGWSDFACSATELSRFNLHMRSQLYGLVCGMNSTSK